MVRHFIAADGRHITMRGLNDDINDLYQAGAKFVVITDAMIHGQGSTPEEAWAAAIAGSDADALGDAQCFDAAPDGAMINDWHTRRCGRGSTQG
jgi:hypothetical protein